MEKITRNGITYFTDRGAVYSVDPPTAHFNLSEWSMLVPPFKPNNMLVLGCAGNTVAKLVRIIHGDVPMVGVDPLECEPVEGMRLHKALAEDYLRSRQEQFDCVILDIFEGATIPRVAREEWFAELVSRACTRLLIFHTAGEDVSCYEKYFSVIHEKSYMGTKIYFMSKEKNDRSMRVPRDI